MLEQIAILQDDEGKLANLNNVVKISIYEETKGLTPVQEFSVSKVIKTTKGLRDFSESLSHRLGTCKILLGSLMTGIFFQTMTKKGFTLLEADSYDAAVLEVIFADRKMKQDIQENTLLDVPKKPEPVDQEGNYFLDFYQLQKLHPEISSKKAILPFLSHELFVSLTLICSHVMPWLDNFCEEHNLTYSTKREAGAYRVVITHKRCKEELVTKYGDLSGYVSDVYHSYHQLKEVMLTQRNVLTTPYGKLIPKYQMTSERDKFRNSLSFYPNGNLKSIYLEERVSVSTSIGTMNAEFLTFYEGEELHRIFPKYGQLSGYWSEENEYEQEAAYQLELIPCIINNKIASFTFYPQGELAAATIISSQKLTIDTPVGKIQGRHGVALYKNGKLKSMEPLLPTKISTVLGTATVYDTQAVGMNAEKNSLEFGEDGTLIGMAVVAESLRITGESEEVIYSPSLQPSRIDPEQLELLPLYLSLTKEYLSIRCASRQEYRYSRESNEFQLIPFSSYCSSLVMGGCGSCNGCKS
jgi:hypothetical protein